MTKELETGGPAPLNRTSTAWFCKIGTIGGVEVPPGGDAPLRRAVEEAFEELIGVEAQGCFSGWGEEFTPAEIAVLKNEMPPRAEPAVPEGWKLVPVELIERAAKTLERAAHDTVDGRNASEDLRDLIAAAPQPGDE